VLLIPLEGHAVGHLGLLLQLGPSRRVLLCGDAVYQASHITQGQTPGVMAQQSCEDQPQMLRSLELLRHFHRENPDVELIPSHDVGWGERCRGGHVPLGDQP
jgi:glyoxylase-like metal-dependent hydrolase (beta-lactamase superfamily II)